MASDETSNASASRNPDSTVLARDQYGAEHRLEVINQHGLVVLRDDVAIRILSPRAAIELAQKLIHATGGHSVGPLSSTY